MDLTKALTRGVALVVALTCSVLVQAALAQDRAALEAAEEQAFKQAAAIVAPSIVKIDTTGGLDVVGQLLTSTAPTTGLIVASDGYVVSSAFQFISKPSNVLVTLPDGRRFPAKTIATDRLRMITLLKIAAENLPVPKAAPKTQMHVGQWSIALGRTFDSPNPAMSVGIVSALNRIWGKAIQTDAKISPTNYGGPLVDLEGRVMGVLAPLSPEGQSEASGVEWYDSGIGFAVPLEDILQVLERLKKGVDLRPGLLGVGFKSRDLFAAAEVDRVRYDSPASNAGLKKGDIVVEADGKPVTRMSQIREVLGTKLEDDKLKLVVKRGEEKKPVEVALVGELKPYESAFLGILPERVANNAAVTEAGVGVRLVLANSAASKAGLQPRDRIVKLNGTPLTSARQLSDSVSRIRPGDEVTLDTLRGKDAKSLKLKLTGVPDEIPADVPSFAVPAGAKPAGDKAPKLGRFTGKLPGYDQEYWAFVPEDYNPNYGYGLLVWVHPLRDTFEATMLQEWKKHCEQRGLILVAPKAANAGVWGANEVELVKDLTQHFRDTYSIDPARIAIHGYATSGFFASQVAFKYRDHFRAVLLAGAPLRTAPPDAEPDQRLQFHFICGDRDPVMKFITVTEKRLKELKIPTTVTVLKDTAAKYPSGDAIEEAVRWLDALDRI